MRFAHKITKNRIHGAFWAPPGCDENTHPSAHAIYTGLRYWRQGGENCYQIIIQAFVPQPSRRGRHPSTRGRRLDPRC